MLQQQQSYVDALLLTFGMAAVQCPPAHASATNAQRPTPQLPLPSDIHVLLVDDEKLSRTVVGNLLKKCDYKGELCLRMGRVCGS